MPGGRSSSWLEIGFEHCKLCQVLRSTVSLCFVLQIDEGLYNAVVPKTRKELQEARKFGVAKPNDVRPGLLPNSITKEFLFASTPCKFSIALSRTDT